MATVTSCLCGAMLFYNISLASWGIGAHAQESKPLATLTVRNPTAVSRQSEVVDLPLTDVLAHTVIAEANHLVVSDDTGRRLLTQVYASRVDEPADRFLVLVDLPPRRTVNLVFDLNPAAETAKTKVSARQVPERKDDFAWENDVVAFRVYGPGLQAAGEITSGIDIWSKRVPEFVIDNWYARDAEGARTHNPTLSYHRDNGQGLDSYKVGETRGCGGTALWADGHLVPSQNAISARILAEGPIRLDFVLEYAPWQVGSKTVQESTRVTLDAGSHLNHMRSVFHVEGDASLTAAAGLGLHPGAELHQGSPGVVSVWDVPQLGSAGRIATGLIVPLTEPIRFVQTPSGPGDKSPENVLLLVNLKSGEPFDYDAGTGWSQGDMPQFDGWNAYLEAEKQRRLHPVSVTWKPRSIDRHN
ncbi:MAG: DUF4861 family protein [Janthinobacterium lividum]